MEKYLKNNLKGVQILLVVLVWLLLFATPILFSGTTDEVEWDHIFKIWKEYSILLVIFLINRFVFMPYLFLKEKRIAYFISITAVILLSSIVMYLIQDLGRLEPFPDFPHLPEGGVPPGPGFSRGGRGPREFIPPFANMVIMSVLLIGFDSGLIFFSKWMVSEKNKLKAEKESIRNKMAFLQNQVSPHFFMNTLNNIHALVDIDTEEAKSAIIQLSQMMDYMLYESQLQGVSLKQEMDFIRSYVELMKLRITDDVDLKLEIPEILPQVKIPPLLTISFIENAFKYGVSYQNSSFIHINMGVRNKRFLFQVENRIHQEIKQNKNSGIGIDNTQKRLELLFGKNYELNIDKNNNTFKVNLSIPL
jgi:hypothetical protein